VLLRDCAWLTAWQHTLFLWLEVIIWKHRLHKDSVVRSWVSWTCFTFVLFITWIHTWNIALSRAWVLAHSTIALIFNFLLLSYFGSFYWPSTGLPIKFHRVNFLKHFFLFGLNAIHSNRTLCCLRVLSLHLYKRCVAFHWRIDWWQGHAHLLGRRLRHLLPLKRMPFVLHLFGLDWLCLLLDFNNLSHVKLFWIVGLVRLLPRHQNLPSCKRRLLFLLFDKLLCFGWAQARFVKGETYILLSVSMMLINREMVVQHILLFLLLDKFFSLINEFFTIRWDNLKILVLLRKVFCSPLLLKMIIGFFDWIWKNLNHLIFRFILFLI
jgi:hypothetical protein